MTRRIEVLVKNNKKNIFFLGGEGSGGGGSGWGVRVDVNEELKFWGKFTKKNRGVGGRGSGRGGGRVGGGGGGGGWGGGWGVRVDVNGELKFL